MFKRIRCFFKGHTWDRKGYNTTTFAMCTHCDLFARVGYFVGKGLVIEYTK